MRFLLSLLLCVWATSLAAATIPETSCDDGPDAMSSNGRKLSDAFMLGHIGDLDETLRVWWKECRRFRDGRLEIFAFQLGMASWLSSGDQLGNPDTWKEDRFIIEMQRHDHPHSIAATLALAEFWYEWAWNARGTAYANEVSPEGWKLYHERLEKSRQILEAAKSFAAANPLWYYQMLCIANEQAWDEDRYNALFNEAARRYPGVLFFYFARTTHLTPKWGGSASAFDDFVQRTVGATRARDGEAMYARLYWSYDGQQVRGNLFDETYAQWPRMNKASKIC